MREAILVFVLYSLYRYYTSVLFAGIVWAMQPGSSWYESESHHSGVGRDKIHYARQYDTL